MKEDILGSNQVAVDTCHAREAIDSVQDTRAVTCSRVSKYSRSRTVVAACGGGCPAWTNLERKAAEIVRKTRVQW